MKDFEIINGLLDHVETKVGLAKLQIDKDLL